MKNLMIIVNPTSGDNQGASYAQQLKENLAPHFDQVELMETERDGDATDFARQACEEGYDSVYVIGGDGTINEVVNGIAEQDHRPKMGFLPGGTNNTYAQLFNMSNDIEESIEQINLEEIRAVDIGKCNDTYFSYYACFGEMIDATTSTSSEEKERLGTLAYAKNIVKALPNDQVHELQIKSDTESFEGKASHVFVLLTNQVGNLRFSKKRVSLQDGEFDVVIVTDEGLGAKLSALKDMVFGQLNENENITAFTCRELSITCSDKEDIQLDLDGDMGPKLPAQIKVLPQHIQFYVPEAMED
ncbi:diacylglycerol kinase family lipid kinase [Aerococcus sp. UMB1112A]|uniref:diacylglycerol/lipid kinase family protein n=1 Tax=Aerococcus sp. UMB1112A TaxID=3050609 RepID=UPI00254B2042|nr:diacylglycerol kinase family lipid kinase [Aerococcus sp. UMB1112A]MDK8503261.1 diacylglycerol kinase family lipid kinase [Aerococcus sp. UMB1112A]